MTMRYSKGPNKGKLISPYLQNKACEYVSQNLYKYQISVTSLQETNNEIATKIKQLQQQNNHLIHRTQSLGVHTRHLWNQKSKHIFEIQSLVRQSQNISDTAFKNKIKSIFKINEFEYTRIFYEFLIGEPSQNWLSTSTLNMWHQEVSQLHIATQISQIACASAFGVMQAPVIITTNLLNILKYNSENVLNAVIESIKKEELDIMKCILWTIDNTAYMSSNKKEAFGILSGSGFSQNPYLTIFFI
ncbi:4418_t:CDS:2 [Funneliformis geosporum]|uniref:4418_t:CDS:1 n=1 Tax=Funneliformis geosporum TaxID=1117311 RepID=A0A9W4SY65_9GLOM|nr:4418_t:CDS:2 [Funneliformis geosporum]